MQNSGNYGFIGDQLLIKRRNSSFIERRVSKSQWIDPKGLIEELYSEQQVLSQGVKILQAPLLQWHFPALKYRRNDYQQYLDILSLEEFQAFHRKSKEAKNRLCHAKTPCNRANIKEISRRDKMSLAIIPARGGSKGIKNKNLVLLNNKPLIYYTIKAALNAKSISKVVVSSDSDEFKLCKSQNVDILKRPISLAQDDTTSDKVLLHALNFTKIMKM